MFDGLVLFLSRHHLPCCQLGHCCHAALHWAADCITALTSPSRVTLAAENEVEEEAREELKQRFRAHGRKKGAAKQVGSLAVGPLCPPSDPPRSLCIYFHHSGLSACAASVAQMARRHANVGPRRAFRWCRNGGSCSRTAGTSPTLPSRAPPAGCAGSTRCAAAVKPSARAAAPNGWSPAGGCAFRGAAGVLRVASSCWVQG